MRNILSLAILAFVAVTCSLRAQEIQVPFDSSGRLEVIDRQLEERLRIFPDVPDFAEARLYQESDSMWALEIYHESNGRRTRTRRELTAEGVADLRGRVNAALFTRSPSSLVDQEGRTRLLVSTTTLGLALYGWAIPEAFNVDNTRAFVAIYTLTAAGSFFVPFFVTQHSRVTPAQATMAGYGGAMGFYHGTLLYLTLAGSGNEDYRTLLASGVLVGLAEGIGGSVMAGHTGMSEATSDMIVYGGMFGTVFGGMGAVLAGVDEYQQATAMLLIGSYAGSYAGSLLTRDHHYTPGDASVVATTGLLGTGSLPGILYLAGYEAQTKGEAKVYAATTMTGMIGGFLFGHSLVADHDFSTAQGNYIALGTIAGSLLGVGTAYVLTEDDPKAFTAGAILGGAGGFALMYSIFADDASVSGGMGGLHLDVSPAGIGAALSGAHPPRGTTIPIAGLSWTY